MPIYVPKKIVQISPTTDAPLFFLAGPIRGGGDWQSRMVEHILDRNQDAHIACPSRWNDEHRLAHHFYRPFSQAENRQLAWERHYLRQAGLETAVPGCVIFWLECESATHPHPGPEPYAMDTRREIGKFTAYMESMDVRMVIGGNPSFYGLDVILRELNGATEKQVVFSETMEEIVDQALCVALQ